MPNTRPLSATICEIYGFITPADPPIRKTPNKSALLCTAGPPCYTGPPFQGGNPTDLVLSIDAP